MIIFNEENIQKITLNKIETKEKDINQRNQIISQDKLLGYEDISPICVKLPKDAKIIKNSVLYEKEIDFDFQFIHEIRLCFCIKDKKNLIYKYASESLDNSIDIETLITKNNEVDMIKKFLFDENQIKIFDTLSRFTTVTKFFTEIKESNENISQENNSEKINQILKNINHLQKRGSKKDKKFISFFKDLFNLN